MQFAQVSIVGVFEGYEQSKSQPGMYYVYLAPAVTPPKDLLKTIRCQRKFGQPLQGQQKLGTIAILTHPDKLPSLPIGTRVLATASYWPVSRPVWSDRDSAIVTERRTRAVFLLESEIKKTELAAKPITARISGTFQTARKSGDKTAEAHIGTEEQPPEGVLREVSVQKGKFGFVTAREVLGMQQLSALLTQLPDVKPGTPVTVDATLWPIREPYYSQKTDKVEHETVPTAVFIATGNLVPEKVKAGA